MLHQMSLAYSQRLVSVLIFKKSEAVNLCFCYGKCCNIIGHGLVSQSARIK